MQSCSRSQVKKICEMDQKQVLWREIRLDCWFTLRRMTMSWNHTWNKRKEEYHTARRFKPVQKSECFFSNLTNSIRPREGSWVQNYPWKWKNFSQFRVEQPIRGFYSALHWLFSFRISQVWSSAIRARSKRLEWFWILESRVTQSLGRGIGSSSLTNFKEIVIWHLLETGGLMKIFTVIFQRHFWTISLRNNDINLFSKSS